MKRDAHTPAFFFSFTWMVLTLPYNPNPHSTFTPNPSPKKLRSLIPSSSFFNRILIYWYLPRKPNFRSHASPIRSRDSLLLLLHLSFRTQTDTMVPLVVLLTWDCYSSPVVMTFFSHTTIITFLSGPSSQDLALRTWVLGLRQTDAQTHARTTSAFSWKKFVHPFVRSSRPVLP